MSIATAAVSTHARFKCGKCGAKIEKSGAFILVKADNQKLHAKCAGVVLDKTVTADQVKDLDKLDQADQDVIRALVSASAKPAPAAAAVNAAGRPKRKAAVAKQADSDSEEEDSQVSEQKPAKKAKAPAKPKPAPKPTKAKKEPESEEEDDKSDSEEKPAKKAKKAKKPKEPTPVKYIIPADMKAKIAAAEEALEGKSQADLKEMLKKNDQTYSSLKAQELIAKVADQQVRGSIPRCQKCFGGKLRWEKGIYYCPGYGDDEGKFRRCSFKGAEGDITRNPWKD